LRIFRRISLAVCLWATLTFVAPATVMAQGSLSFVRDAETEYLLRVISNPLFDAAGIPPESVRIFLVNDGALNAFVAGGQNMFINLGLLTGSKTVEEVIGVIAHETGHIAGGHLVRGQDAIRQAVNQSILTTILGIGAGVLTGRGDVAQAIIAGGNTTASRGFLGFSRTQESAADRAAFRYLEETGQTARGLQHIMQQLEGQEALNTGQQDPYLRTHPLSSERIEAIENHMATSAFSDATAPAAIQDAFLRVRAKVLGFTKGWQQVIREFPTTDISVPARYARAYAAWRRPDSTRALTEMDSLISEYPDDPYFLEFVGQLKFEVSDVPGALDAYQRAAAKLPNSPLIVTELARVQIETGDPVYLEDAIKNLRISLRHDRRSAATWRLLGIAYSRLGDEPNSTLALAEESSLRGDWQLARRNAGKAETLFKEGTPGWLQAQDILAAADRAREAAEKRQ